MNIDNFNKICVIGWGKSGFYLCKLILSLKKKVCVSEIRERKFFPSFTIDWFRKQGVDFEFGAHTEKFIKGCDLLVLSPGVDFINSPLVDIVHNLRIPYVGEVEFSFWLSKAKFIAITGTNGKTTTTFLTYRVLKEKKKRVFLGGNIGIPISSFVLSTKKNDLIVSEISSFQLETIVEFRPYVACLINIDPNHLDRHPTFETYLKAKLNIFKNQKETDWAVINKDTSLRYDIEKNINSKIVYFSSEFSNENLSCSYRIASLFGLTKIECSKIFSNFKGLPHRLQFIKEIKGIKFINDSKSTNPSSTIWALKNIKDPIILIAGGKDKKVDYSAILPYLKNIKKLNLIGESANKIKEVVSNRVPTQIFNSLEEAVFSSYKDAKPLDTVLFSPMCSSFDMFSNYIERGKKFIEIVNKLQ